MSGIAPDISFIIPAYNAARTLPQTIASLQAQDMPAWEAIVVDDGSRDRTTKIAAALAARDPRVRLVRQANAGPSAARNRGLAEARAERITFLDADDWIAPDFLTVLLPLAAGPDRLAYCAYSLVLPSGTVSPPDFCRQLQDDPFAVLAWRCEPAIHCVVAPRRLILAVGGFDENMRCCEDWDLWLRLVRAGARFVGTPRALAFYRMLPGSLSTQAEGGEKDAETVKRRARQIDPRLPADAPFRAALVLRNHDDDTPAPLLTEAIERVSEGAPAPRDWFLADPGKWHSLIMQDPEGFPALVFQHNNADAALYDALIGALRDVDPAFTAAARDAFDLYRAKVQDGVFGRYLSITLDPASLAERIEPPPGVDSLVLRFVTDAAEPGLLALPLPEAMTREQLVAALVAAVPLAPLLRSSKALRSPRFWLAAGRRFAAAGLARPAALLGNPRAVIGQSLRSGIVRALAGSPLELPRVPPREIAIPILLVPTITANDSELLSAGIGQAQLAALLELLRAEGYGRITLERIMELRRQPDSDGVSPIALVFSDFASARQSGMLDQSGGSDVLLTPTELRQLADKSGGLPRTVRFGLQIDRFAADTGAALTEAREHLRLLHHLNGNDRPVAAISERHGLDDAILARAGFAPILSPASRPLRLSAHGDVFPVIDCSGAEALGTVVECLRAA